MARTVKPMPSPPTRTTGARSVRARSHANAASASSEPCMRLDIRIWPPAKMTNSVSRRCSFMSVPSGIRASPSSSQGFMTWQRYPLAGPAG